MSDKLTPEELQELQQFRFSSNQLAASLGDLHYQKTILDLELERVKEGIKENLQKQQAHLRELGQKYGDVSINFEDGTLKKFEEQPVESE
jgi:hypothetical protein